MRTEALGHSGRSSIYDLIAVRYGLKTFIVVSNLKDYLRCAEGLSERCHLLHSYDGAAPSLTGGKERPYHVRGESAHSIGNC